MASQVKQPKYLKGINTRTSHILMLHQLYMQELVAREVKMQMEKNVQGSTKEDSNPTCTGPHLLLFTHRVSKEGGPKSAKFEQQEHATQPA